MTLVYKVLRHMGKAMPLPDSGLCRYDGFNDAMNNIDVVCIRTPAHQTQVAGLGNRHLELPSHLPGPLKIN